MNPTETIISVTEENEKTNSQLIFKTIYQRN